MSRLKKIAASLGLALIALCLGLSILFYHVSAVVKYNQNQNQRFITMVENLHNLTDCEWVSEIMITKKIVTLKCLSPVFGDRYLHFDEKWSILGELNPKTVDFENAKAAFTQNTKMTDFTISLTYFDQQSVYWISKESQEWLLDLSDFSILWKVDKNYE
jgi:hypothetical protein